MHPTNMTDGVWSEQARWRLADRYRPTGARLTGCSRITGPNPNHPPLDSRRTGGWRGGAHRPSTTRKNRPFHNVQVAGSADSHYYLPHTGRTSRPRELRAPDALLCDTDGVSVNGRVHCVRLRNVKKKREMCRLTIVIDTVSSQARLLREVEKDAGRKCITPLTPRNVADQGRGGACRRRSWR